MKPTRLTANLVLLLGAFSLSNPLRAQEQLDASDGVGVDVIDGVNSTSVDEFGNLILTMESGETVTVLSGEYFIYDGSYYLTSDALANLGLSIEDAAAVVVAAAGGGGGGSTLLLVGGGVLLLAAAAGGGGGGSSAPAPAPAPPVNNAPSFTSANSSNAAENTTTAYDANATDPDGNSITYGLTGTDASLFTINSSTGVVSFINPPDFENPGDSDGDNVYDVNVTASDGSLSVSQGVSITVTDQNDAPVVSAAIEDETSENAGLSVDLLQNASDQDGDTLSIANVVETSGNDASGVSISGSTLTVDMTTYDYLAEGETVVLVYTYDVEDGNGGTVSTSATITITGQNDAPILAVVDIAATEDGAPVDGASTASDVDTSDTHVFTTTQPTEGSVSIDAATGVYTFDPGEDFQYLADGETTTVSFDVTVTDNNGLSDTQTVTVTVTGTNDVPVIVEAESDLSGDVTQVPLADAASSSAFTAVGEVIGVNELNGILPTEGSSMALLNAQGATDAEIEAELGLAPGTLDVHAGQDVVDGSGITTAVTLTAGQVVTFDWNFQDAEGDVPVTTDINDFAFVSVNGDVSYLERSSDVDTNEWTTYSFTAPADGTYVFGIGVVNEGDDAVDSQLLVDNFSVDGVLVDGAEGLDSLTTSGTITFTDLDFTDTHGTEVEPDAGNTLGGIMVLTGVSEDPTTEPGTFDWTYVVDNEATAYLAEGETTTESFTVFVGDDFSDIDVPGTFDSQVITITITGTNDAPVISVVDLAATEDGATVDGTATFTDVDLIDTHEFTTTQPLEGSVTIDAATGVYTFDPGADFQYLADAETATVTFDVTVTDNNGLSDTQTVSVTVTGTNDTPIIEVVDVEGAVIEDATMPNLTDAGSVTFTEIDDTDVITSSVALTAEATDSAEPIPADLSAALASAVTITQTGTNDGDIAWDFSLDNALTQYIADGETVTATYTITVMDDSGTANDTATQDVTVVITGTNDQPTLTILDTDGAMDEGDDNAVLSDSGALSFDDIDATDIVTVSQTYNDDIAYSGALDPADPIDPVNLALEADLIAGFSVDQDSWDYTSSEDLDFLGLGETITLSFDVVATDDSGTANNTSDPVTVTITFTGTNDAAVVTGVVEGEVGEGDLVDTVFGDLNHTDVDNTDPDGLFQADSGATTYGTYTVDADGNWSFTLDNANPATEALTAGEVVTDSFSAFADDGTEQVITVTINGSNDGAILSADVENLVETDLAADISTSGALTISDVDAGEAVFVAQAGSVGDYGTFTIDATGAWTYTASSAHDEFVDGVTYTDTFSVQSADGTTTSVTINILGTDDAAILSADVVALTETDSALDISTTGTLTISDSDSPEEFVVQTGTLGDYGTFTIDADGSWTYAASTAHNEFEDGVVYTDTFSVESADGTTTSVTINITGTNDAAVVSSDSVDLIETDAALTADGVLTSSDVDNTDNAFTASTTTGTLGEFDIDALGAWTFTANSAFDELNDGDVISETFDVASADGTPSTVTITITGSNDSASIVASLMEDTATTEAGIDAVGAPVAGDTDAGGTLIITDADDGEAVFQAPASLAGTYGDFTFDAATGVWAYTLNNADPDTQALAAGDPATDTLTVTSQDGTASYDIVVNITGTNDAAEITGTSSGLVLEDFAINVVSGDLQNTDIDGTDQVFQAGAGAGDNAYGTYTVDAEGTWTYSLSNANADVNALNVGDTLIDSFTVLSEDGTEQDVTITIYGSNDGPVAVADMVTTNEDTLVNIDVLDNDTDVDNLPADLSVTSVSASNGTVTINPDNTLDYTPDADYNGSDVIFYTISDGNGGVDTGTVAVTVTPVNDAPVFATDAVAASTAEDQVLTGTVNATDVDADVLTYTIEIGDGAANGTAAVDASGNYTYTPNDDFNGTDSFVITVTDNGTGALTDTITVNVTINPINDAPVASVTAAAALTEGVDASGTAVATVSQTDPDAGDTHSYAIIGGNEAGLFTIDAGTGEITTTRDLDDAEVGSYQLTLLVEDAAGAQDAIILDVTVTNVNDAPIVAVDSATTAEDTAVTISAALLLANDTDADGDALSINAPLVTTTWDDDGNAATAEVPAGTVALVDGNLVFTPDTNFVGDVIITYNVNDGTVDVPSSVVVTVGGTNDAPVATVTPTNTSLTENDALDDTGTEVATLSHTDADVGDTHSYAIIAGNEAGLFAIDAGTGVITTTRDLDDAEVGSYQLTLLVEDGAGAQDAVTLDVTVENVNDAPVVTVDAASTAEDTPVTISGALLVSNDTDADGDTLSIDTDITVAPTASSGTVALVDGDLVFTPAENFVGNVTITYNVTDGNGASVASSVVVSVSPVNDAPVTDDAETLTVDEDTAGMVSPLTGDTDVDDDTLTITGAVASNGTVTESGGVLTYTPDADFNGSDEIVYTISDGNGGVDTGTIAVTVNPVNDAPVIAGEDTGTVTEDVDVTAGTPDTIETSGNLTVTDVDAGEAAFSTTVVTQGVLGELTIDALGNWTYVADNTQAAIQSLGEGESTTDTITVESADGTDHDIVITIIGTNDGPVAANLENTDLQSEDEAAYTVDLNVANILGITLADLGTDVDNTLTSESFSLNGVTIAGTLYSAADAGIGYNPTTGEITINTGTDAYQYLAENETAEVVVSYTVTDGLASDTGTVTFTVTGVNDAAIITGNDAGDVAEDALVDSATGDLNNTDVDGADNVFQAAGPTATTLGTYEVDADGTWTYTLDNGNTTVDALAEGETTTDSFSVLSEDGTSQLVTVTITGANDAPVAVDVDLTAAPQFEDEAVVTIDLATGLDNYGNDLGLTIAAVATDVDSTLTIASFSLNDVTIDGTLYSAADAGISYDPGTGLITVDTSVDAYQGLSATDVASVVASFTVTDDFGATDTATVTFAVNGVNDAAIITGNAVGEVVEDFENPTTTGNLDSTDVDGTDDLFVVVTADPTIPAESNNSDNGYGTFSIDAAGGWIYTLDNTIPPVQQLNEGEILIDTFTATTEDGTEQVVTISIYGTDDPVNSPPTVVGPLVSTEPEDAPIYTVDMLFGAEDPVEMGLENGLDVFDASVMYSLNGATPTATAPAGVTFNSTTNELDVDPADDAFQALAIGETDTIVVTYQITDPYGATVDQTATINITGTNDAPEITVATPVLTPTTDEDTTSSVFTVASILGTSVDDVDNGAVEGMAITGASGNGTWQYTLDGTFWIALPVDATPNDANALLLDASVQLRYVPDGENGETATLTYRAWDQTDGNPSGTTGVDVSTNGGTTAYSADTDTASLTVTDVNDAPVVDLDANDSSTATGNNYLATYTENGAAIAVMDSDVTITDVDNNDANMEGAIVHLMNGEDGDVLTLNETLLPAGITVDVGMTTATFIVLTGSASLSDYQDALQLFTYENTGDNPVSGDRLIEVSVNDGDVSSDIAISTITVVAVNDAPAITVTANDFTEDAGGLTAGTSEAGTYVTTDEEMDGLTVDFTVPTTHYTLDQIGHVYLTQAGIDAINAGQALDAIDLTVTDDGTPVESGADSDTPVVTAVNDAPTITVTAAPAINENSAAAGDVVATFTAADEEDGTPSVAITSISDPDGYYVINGTNVELTADGATFVQGGGTLYDVDLTATDTGTLTASDTATPAVTAENDAPTITVTANDFTEDAGGLTAGTSVAGTYVTTDEEMDGLTVTFTAPTTHYTLDQIGNVYLTQAGIDAINAGQALDAIDLTVTDDGTPVESGTDSDTPVVTPVNDAPTITVTANDFTEDAGAAVGDAAGTYVTTDEEGDTLTVTFTTGTNLNNHYVLANGQVELTQDGVDAINAGQALDAIDLTVTDDGMPNESGTGSDTPVVTPVNDAPTITVTANDFTEDAGGLTAGTSVAGTYVTTDEEMDGLTVTFTAPTTHYTLDQSGHVYLTQAGIDAINAGGPMDAIDLTVTDDGMPNESGTGSDTPEITLVNDDPFNDGTIPTSINVTEDAVNPIDLSGIDLADEDVGLGLLTLTLTTNNAAFDGNLIVSEIPGVAVTGNGTGTVTLTGTLANLNAYLDNTSNISYTNGVANANSTSVGSDDSITVTVSDNGNTGTGGGGDVALGTITVVVDDDIEGLDADEAVATDEDDPIDVAEVDGVTYDNLIDPALVNHEITGFTVDINGDGILENFAANGTAVITGVGSLSVLDDGTYSFTPNLDYFGPVPIVTYTIEDSANLGVVVDTSTLSISVDPVDDAFADASEIISVNEDTTLNNGVLIGTVSADGPVTVTTFTVDGDLTVYNAGETALIAGIGTLQINQNGDYTFIPEQDYNGAVPQVTYFMTDGLNDLNPDISSTLDITVDPVDDAPVITDGPDTYDHTETDAGFTTMGTMAVTDVDQPDTVTATVDSTVAVTGNGNGIIFDGMLSIDSNPVIDGTGTTGTIAWTFSSSLEAFDHLAVGETLELVYTIRATDDATAMLSGTETVTITITGTNDAPVITSAAMTDGVTDGDVTEIADLAPGENVNDLTDTGTITFDDVDLSDTHTVTTTEGTSDNGAFLGSLTAVFDPDSTGTGSGAVDWTYTVNDSAIDFLDSGETITETFTVTIDDGNGGMTTETVTITINGTDDAAIISVEAGDSDTGAVTEDTDTDGAAGIQLQSSGTLTVTDADASDPDTFDTVVAYNAGASSDTSGASVATPTGSLAIDANGNWEYTGDNDAVQYLAEGEVRTEVFTVSSSDGLDTHDITITITGTNDDPVISGTDISVGGGGEVTIDFTGINGNAIYSEDGFTFTHPSHTDASNELTWHDPGNVTVTADDGGVFNIVSTDVTSGNVDFITAAGTVNLGVGNNQVVGLNGVTSATLDENGWGSIDNLILSQDSLFSETDTTISATGTLNVVDTDTSDTVALTVTSVEVDATSTFAGVNPLSNMQLQAMMEVTTGALAADQTAGTDFVWTFTSGAAGNGAFNFLANGETLVLEYTITATDDSASAGTDSQVITVTITGTNDEVLVSGAVSSGAVEEDVTAQAVGTIDFTDVDLSDDHVVTYETTSTDYTVPTTFFGTFTAVETADTTGTGTGGLVSWTYDIDNAAAQELAEGQQVMEVYTVTIDDQNGDTVTQDVTITITGTNDAPVLATTYADSALLEYVENDAPTAIDDSLTISDVDITDTIVSATVSIVNGTFVMGEDVLAFTDTADITASYDAATGILTLSETSPGSATRAEMEAALQTVTYANTSDDPSTGVRTIEFTINDGLADSNTTVRTLTVTEVNDAPTTSQVDLGIIIEDSGTPVVIDQTTLLSEASDIEGDNMVATNLTTNGLGTLVLTGDGEWTYTPAVDESGQVDFSYVITDDGTTAGVVAPAVSDPAGTAVLTITAQPDAPVAKDDLVETNEDNFLIGNVLVDNGNGEDTDADFDTLTVVAVNGVAMDVGVTVTLASGAQLTLDANGTFNYDPNGAFESLDENDFAEDSFSYTISDGDMATPNSTATVTVTINGANDAPTIAATTYITDSDEQTITELTSTDSNAGLQSVGTTTLTVNDVDGSDVVTATVDSVGVVFDSAASVPPMFNPSSFLSLEAQPVLDSSEQTDQVAWSFDSGTEDFDFINEGETLTLTYTVGVTDDSGLMNDSGFTTVTITIVGTNDTPILTADTDAITETGGTTTTEAAFETGNVLTNDVDPDLTDTLSVTQGSAGTDAQADLVFDQGVGMDEAVIVGTYGDLYIKADGSYRYELVDARVDPLDDGDMPNDVFNYTASDDDGNAMTATATATSTLTITVNGTNDAPIAVDDSNNDPAGDGSVVADAVVEAGGIANGTAGDASAAGTVLGNDTDVDDAMSVTFIGGNAVTAGTTSANGTVIAGTYGSLTIGADGTYSYALDDNDTDTQALDDGDTGMDTFTYTVSDGTASDTAVLTVNVQGANDAPVITNTLVDYTYQENFGPAGIFNINATDAEGETGNGGGLVFALTGVDASLFTISNNGQVSFIAAPDYEMPQDDGMNNVYNITVVVTDDNGAGLSDSLDFTITVTNLPDPTKISFIVETTDANATALDALNAEHTDALSLEQDMGFMGGLDSVLDFSGLTDLSAITADASSLSGPVIVAEAQSISVTNLSDNTSSAQMEALDLSDNAQAPVMELSVESAIDLNAQEVSLQEAIDLAGSIDQNLEAPVLDVPGTVLSEAGSVGTSGGHISQEALAQANTAGSDVFDVWADAETVSDQLFLNEVAQLSDNMT